MKLNCIKEYFAINLETQIQLEGHWGHFNNISSYALFKCIANKCQSKIDGGLVRGFIESFNWEARFSGQSPLQERTNYSIHSLVNLHPSDLLTRGIQLLIDVWGKQQGIVFDEFSLLVKGDHEMPHDEQICFQVKRQLYECIVKEILYLIKIQSIKKIVFHQYGNLSDLFESLTASNLISEDHVKRLFLSFSQKLSNKQLKLISKRCRLPWDFNKFINTFKNEVKKKQYKIFHSATRIKNNENDKDLFFTTPKKQKHETAMQSTKLTRKYESASIQQTPYKKQAQKKQMDSSKQQYKQYIKILGTILQLEQQYNYQCSQLIKKNDFDLELVFQQFGQKFQNILNSRYGLCNFSAFVRFIVPKDQQHRYLSFNRYQSNDIISHQTQQKINSIIQQYYQKQQKISELWKICDKQIFFRYFCLPKQQTINSKKLLEYFTKRQTTMLLERFDPHKIGRIGLDALY